MGKLKGDREGGKPETGDMQRHVHICMRKIAYARLHVHEQPYSLRFLLTYQSRLLCVGLLMHTPGFIEALLDSAPSHTAAS